MWTRIRPVVFAALAAAVPAVARAQADYAVVFATEPSSVVAAGDVITVDYDVENHGTTSGDTTIGFIIDNGVDAWLLHEEPVATLAVGDFTSGTMSFAVPTGVDGLWYWGVIADPFDMVVETDEMDNVFQFSGQLTIGGGTTGSITVIIDPLPAARVGSSYSATLRQTGATAPNWYLSSGTLPNGLTLSASGEITGVPQSSGSFTFIANAEQVGFTPGSGSFTINVSPGMSPITISPSTLPQAQVGVPFEAWVTASGGNAPYGYQLVNAPSWLMMVGAGADAGQMHGTPDGVGHFMFTLYVIDTSGADLTSMLSIDVVQAGALSIAPSTPDGVTGKEYSASLVSGGTPPYTTQISSGALPPGLAVDAASGTIAGVPSMKGDFTFGVSVSDAQGATASGSFHIAITELSSLEISSKQITVFVNGEANAPLTASGGVPPYSWTMLGGSLPDGVSFDVASAKIVGKPTKVGMGTATFSVSDSEGTTAQGDVEVVVQVFQPGRSGGPAGGGARRDGCTCVRAAGEEGSSSSLFAWALISLVGALYFGLQRSRVER